MTLAGPSHVAGEGEIGEIGPDASLHWSFTFHLKMVGNIEFYIFEVYLINRTGSLSIFINFIILSEHN